MYNSDIKFEKKDHVFNHNLDGDYAYFALWKAARPYRDRIRELLEERFELLLETEVHWSEEYFHENAARIYEEPIYANIPQNQRRSMHAQKIGDNAFIIFVIKDKTPKYNYAMSVSGKIELCNTNIVEAKSEIRKWIEYDIKIQYAVHSTNTIYEFFHQIPLILGIANFKKLLDGEKLELTFVAQDLVGAGGWESWQQLFDILNITSNYLVLRGFESLPIENPEPDLDVLTDNYQRFASAAGARQKSNQPYKAFVQVAGEEISLDIRYVGDKYYDPTWAADMLAAKENKRGVMVPEEAHYFFSLLYHAKVQKPAVKEKYVGLLQNIAENLGFNWYSGTMLKGDKLIGQLLNGYMATQHYYYEDPIDKGVYKNTSVVKYLQTPQSSVTKERFRQKAERWAKRVLPDSLIGALKKMLGN